MSLVQTTTQFTFLDTLGDLLAAREGLAGVQVLTAAVDPETAIMRDTLQLLGVRMDEEFQSLGRNRHEEDYTVSGEIVVLRPGAPGMVEQAIRASRDRAAEILAEVEDELRRNHRMNGVVAWCRVASVETQQGWNDKGRLVILTFTIRVKASLGLD